MVEYAFLLIEIQPYEAVNALLVMNSILGTNPWYELLVRQA